MRILVDDFLNGKQVPGRSQLLDDRSIRIVRRKTGKFSGQFGQIAKFIDRYDDLNLWIMLRADIKVLNTVSRRGMDAAGAALQRDMVAKNDRLLPVKERMLVGDVFQLLPETSAQDFVICNSGSLHRSPDKLLGHYIIFAVCSDDTIFKCRPDTDCLAKSKSSSSR